MFQFEQVIYKDIIDIRALTIHPGLTALVGPSGSGKTTLLRLMNKMISPDAGIIYYQGINLSELPAVEHRRSVMMLSQTPILFPGNIRDNLNAGFKFQKKEVPTDQRLLDMMLQVQLDKELDGLVESLSGGEKQRLALARVFLLEPEVYLLDEPSAALDDVSEDAIVSMLSRYTKEKGKSAIMVTHARSIAEKYCDEIIELKKEGNNG